MPVTPMKRCSAIAAVLAGLLAGSGPAHATITDPTGDFLPTYTGPQDPGLDVISAGVTFDGQQFVLTATLAGPVPSAASVPGALYVWGINRGMGTQRFVTGTPSVGAGVIFDSVLVLRPAGTGAFNDLLTGTSTPLPVGDLQINGATITAELPVSFVTPEGLAPSAYGFNLWPRSGAGSNTQITDFAPDASVFTATPVPEPASLVLLGAGLLGTAAVARRRVRLPGR